MAETPISVNDLTATIFAEQDKHIAFFGIMLKSVIEKQEKLIKHMKEEGAIGDRLTEQNVFQK